jgi:tetratricopeptide (TPR) repeat protein
MTPLGEADGQARIDPAVSAAASAFAGGDNDAALALLSPLIASGDPPLAARFLLAMMAWKMGRLDGALALACECHEQDPMDGTVAEVLASLHAQCGDAVESIYAAKLATALGGHGALAALMPEGFPPFEFAYATISEQPRRAAAQRDLAAGRFAAALEHARQHVALEGTDPDGRALYAQLLLRAGRASDAVDELRTIEDEASRSAHFASLYARALAASGEFAAALRWHGEAQALEPGDAAVAAARIADGRWFDEPQALHRAAAAWAHDHCPAAKPRTARAAAGGKTVIAYLVAGIEDRADAAAIAAVAQAHDRARFTVIGYGSGAQSWDDNAVLSGAFDGWQDIAALDGATIARYFRHDAVAAAVDVSGFAAPQMLLALARANDMLRLSWLGNPGALLAPVWDASIDGYPILRSDTPVEDARRDGTANFAADVMLAQLGDDTVALWSAILRASEAKLLLRANDTGRGAVDRLVSRFGAELAARIDLVAADRSEDFWRRAHVALMPRRGVSPRAAAEALACGVPVVAFAAANATEPYGAFLHSLGVPAVANDGDYVRHALTVASGTRPPGGRAAAGAIAHTIEIRIAERRS